MVYVCKVYARGRVQRVAVEAASEREAVLAVWKRVGPEGLLLSVSPAGRRRLAPGGRVGPRDLEMFCRRAHALLRAGITAQESLEALAAHTENRTLRSALVQASESVRSGFPLSVAMRARPDAFPAAFCHTVAAAEEAGALAEAFGRLAVHYAREAAFRDKVKQALTYPAVVAVLAVLVTAGMFGFVVPRFASLLVASGVPLPPITRVTLGLARELPRLAAFVLAAAAAGFLAMRLARPSRRVLLAWERVFLRVPLVGRIVQRAAVARACRALAMMVQTGTPVPRALEVTGRAASLESLRVDFEGAAGQVKAGGPLARALSSRLFPATVQKMVAVGEASGDLAGMLGEAAALLEMEVDALMQRLPPFVESGMLILVGGNVAFIMLSLFMPILSLYQAVQR